MKCSTAALVALFAVLATLAAPTIASSASCVQDMHAVIVAGHGPQHGCLQSVTSSFNSINVLTTVGLTVAVLLTTVTSFLTALFIEIFIQLQVVLAVITTFNGSSLHTAFNSCQNSVTILINYCAHPPTNDLFVTALGNVGQAISSVVSVVQTLVNGLVAIAVVVTALIAEVIVALTVLLQLVVFGIQQIVLALRVIIPSAALSCYNSLVSTCAAANTGCTNIVVKSTSCYTQSIAPVPFCVSGLAALVAALIILVNSLLNLVLNIVGGLLGLL